MRLCLAVVIAIFGSVRPVDAESIVPLHPLGNAGGKCGTVATSPSTRTQATAGSIAHHAISKVLYVNRCSGGCEITAADQQNAPNNVTAVQGIPRGQLYSVPEFKNFAGQIGTPADTEWSQIVACVAETFSYFDIQVTDVRPGAGPFHMAVVGGTQADIGLGFLDGLLGISQLECSGPLDNVISFTLADSHRPLAGSLPNYVRDLCTTITHEVGHAFGLQHQFRFLQDNTSACSDPMSYETGTCNPDQRYFRNKIAACGRFMEEPCNCPNNPPNSHGLLFQVFGAGMPTVPPPSLVFTTPAMMGGSIANLVAVTAGSKRGVDRVELYLNDWKWLTLFGVPFATGGGQPNPAPYGFQLPARVPDGVYDIRVRAYDDVDGMTEAMLQATKGAPCTTADSCLAGQKCEQGKCFWDPPSGAFGDECTYDEFCTSNVCAGTAELQICTQSCIPGVVDSCPVGENLSCIETGPGMGVCFPVEDSGGCCDVGAGPVTKPVFPILVGGLVITWLRRRRRAKVTNE